MIAIPVKKNSLDTAISPLFGKSKWFALVSDQGDISFWKNEMQSGRKVVEEFRSKGVNKVLFQSMGGNPFLLLQKNNITSYYSEDGRVLLQDALEKLVKKELIEVTMKNMDNYIEKGHKHAKNDHKHTHHKGHHQHH
jgi:predicted Fe-Mo cluster-binding NifX family protein